MTDSFKMNESIKLPEDTWIEIELLEEINNLDLDKRVNISTKFIRGTLEPNVEENIKWIKEVIKGENITISYVCDICDEKYETMEKMNTRKCNQCTRYYDYCKTHESIEGLASIDHKPDEISSKGLYSVSKCPFCGVINI